MGLYRLGHVDVTVTDLDLAVAYYTEVIGLLEVERDEDSVYLKCWDETNHHSLRLMYGPRVGMDQMSFLVEKEDDLDELENKIAQYGFPVQRISKGMKVGQGESIRFQTPSGQTMELVYDVERVGRALPSVNPPPFVTGIPGIAPPRLDHILVQAEEVGEAAHFFTNVFGMQLTEQIIDGNGHQNAVWMQSSGRPHDLAIVTGQNGGLHHFAWWLDDWDHVRRSADILAYNGIQIDIGPTRHGVTRGNTIYFFDPLGTRNEVFTGSYRPDPEFPTITWTEDNIGRAVFYYEGEVNQRFMTVHT